MYFDNLCQLRVPYLPVSEQQTYAQAREKALVDLEAAKARLTQTRQDVEAMILGSKSVGAQDEWLSQAQGRRSEDPRGA